MTDLLLGVVIGIGLAFVYLGVLLLLLERDYAGPFQDATVEDFLPHKEGG